MGTTGFLRSVPLFLYGAGGSAPGRSASASRAALPASVLFNHAAYPEWFLDGFTVAPRSLAPRAFRLTELARQFLLFLTTEVIMKRYMKNMKNMKRTVIAAVFALSMSLGWAQNAPVLPRSRTTGD
jgi:hypothetical protein